MARSRSTTGCWTCRVRRKKCDEEARQCITCLSLRLDCAGYGPRPEWMDGGAKEKQKAQEIKLKVTRQRKRDHPRRRNRRPSDASNDGSQRPLSTLAFSPPPVPDMLERRSDSCERATMLASSAATRSRRSTWESTGIEQDNASPVTQMPDAGWIAHHIGEGFEAGVSSNGAHASQPTLPAAEHRYASLPPVTQSHDFQSLTPVHSATSVDFGVDPSSLRSPWEETWDFSVPYEFEHQAAFDPGPVNNPAPAVMDFPSLTGGNASNEIFDFQTLQEESLGSDPMIDFDLNDILPNTFPFLRPRVLAMIREELLASDMTQKPLAISSARLLASFAHEVGLKRYGLSERVGGATSISPSHEIMAIVRDAHRDLHADQNVLSADVALCLLHLIQLQVRKLHCEEQESRTDECQIRRGLADNDDVPGLIESFLNRRRSCLSQTDALTSFVAGFAVTVDVLWSASKRRRPLLTFDTASLWRFDLDSADFHEVVGCESWVIQSIAQINILRLWKHDSTVSQSLNMTELVKKAAAIEQSMDKKRRKSGSRNIQAITDVYAAGARVYLHVVVSGALPEVSDIRSAVWSTRTAIKSVPHDRLLRRLAWPICVAASLSEARHETFFNQLEQGAQSDEEECQSVLRALRVARECRRLRRQPAGVNLTFDWMDAMESLGCDYQLF